MKLRVIADYTALGEGNPIILLNDFIEAAVKKGLILEGKALPFEDEPTQQPNYYGPFFTETHFEFVFESTMPWPKEKMRYLKRAMSLANRVVNDSDATVVRLETVD